MLDGKRAYGRMGWCHGWEDVCDDGCVCVMIAYACVMDGCVCVRDGCVQRLMDGWMDGWVCNV